MLSYIATGSFGGTVQGLNPLNQQYQKQYARQNGRNQSYLPPVEAIYWSMRGMAYAGSLMALIAIVGAFLYWRRRLEQWTWFLWIAVAGSFLPFVATTFGWLLTELGRQPWIVQGLLLTKNANSPAVSTAWIVTSLTVFISLYIVLIVADIWLMRRYAGRDPRRGGRDHLDGNPRVLMDLQNLWFVLIAVLWSGYFLLEGFDFGVGMLLPFLPRREAERGQMLETIGPVWDGNEVWLVTAGAATFAAFPAWYATMFSGFYLALLLVLFFLIIRVVSFEWRSKAQSQRWRTTWLWANAVGSFGASLIWGVGLANLLYGVPINSSGDFAGSFWDLFSVYTVLGGVTIVLLFAFHGATYLTIRTVGDLCKRAAATARRLSVVAAVVGSVFLAWTVSRGDRQERQGRLPADPAGDPRHRRARARRPLRLPAPQRARVRGDGGSGGALGGDDLHEPLPARDGLQHRASRTASPWTAPRRRTTRWR